MRQSKQPLRAWPFLALLVLATPLTAQEPAQEAAPAETKRNDDARALKRVVHLTGGTTLRAIARKSEGGQVHAQHIASPTCMDREARHTLSESGSRPKCQTSSISVHYVHLFSLTGA